MRVGIRCDAGAGDDTAPDVAWRQNDDRSSPLGNQRARVARAEISRDSGVSLSHSPHPAAVAVAACKLSDAEPCAYGARPATRTATNYEIRYTRV